MRYSFDFWRIQSYLRFSNPSLGPKGSSAEKRFPQTLSPRARWSRFISTFPWSKSIFCNWAGFWEQVKTGAGSPHLTLKFRFIHKTEIISSDNQLPLSSWTSKCCQARFKLKTSSFVCLRFILIEIQEFGTVFERNQKLIQRDLQNITQTKGKRIKTLRIYGSDSMLAAIART